MAKHHRVLYYTFTSVWGNFCLWWSQKIIQQEHIPLAEAEPCQMSKEINLSFYRRTSLWLHRSMKAKLHVSVIQCFLLENKASYTQSLQMYVSQEYVLSKPLKLKSMFLGSHSAPYEISTECIFILVYDRHPNSFVSVHLYL